MMNKLKEKYITQALIDFGLEVEPNIFWFMDERKVYYGKVSDGEVINYTYGTITSDSFLVEFMSSNDELDILEWKTFIETYLETVCITDLI